MKKIRKKKNEKIRKKIQKHYVALNTTYRFFQFVKVFPLPIRGKNENKKASNE